MFNALAKYGLTALSILLGVVCLILVFSIYGLHLPLLGTIFPGYKDRISDLEQALTRSAEELRVCNVQLVTQTESLRLTGVEVITANEYAKDAADACKETQKAVARGRVNAEKIRNAPDTADPGAVYARSLCDRPEARNHPACSE